MKRLLTAGVAALVLVASQAAAVAPDRSILSVADRAASQSETANEQLGPYNPWVVSVVVIAIVVSVIALTNDDSPSSP